MSRGLAALILACAATGLWLWPGAPGPAPSEPKRIKLSRYLSATGLAVRFIKA